MSRETDVENATKAAQTAQLLIQDLQDMNRDGDELISMIILSKIGEVAALRDTLIHIADVASARPANRPRG